MAAEEEGWVKIYRCLQDNRLWQERPFSKGQAWVDLILLANHKDGAIKVRGIRVDVKRGQVGYSIVALATRWGWSRGKTARFLDELEAEQQIEQQICNVTTLISIVNYDRYQGGDTADETAKKEQPKPKKEPAAPVDTALFDEFWQAYPRKTSKAKALEAWKRLNVDALLSARMVQAIEQQKQTEQWQDQDGRFIPHPSTWLNQRRWEDEVKVKKRNGYGPDSPFFGGV